MFRNSAYGLAALLLTLASPFAAAQPVLTDRAEVALHAYTTHAVPGESVWVALRLRPDDGWHTYWKNPGDSGLPTRLNWALPEGVTAGDIQWPHPSLYGLDEFVNYGYGRQTMHLVQLQVPGDWPPGRPLAVQALAEWLICADICIPESAELELEIPVDDTPAAVDPLWQADFDDAFARLPEEVDWPTAQTLDGETIRWHTAMPEASSSARYAIFPEHPETVDHSAQQQVYAHDDGLWLEQPEHPWFEALPERAAWVIVAHADDGSARAWRVTAHAGEVPPRAAGGVAASVQPPATADAPAAPATALWVVLLGALAGGLILNLMPCVFPVLALKALNVLHARDGEHSQHGGQQRLHALAYTAGVVLSCLAVAGLLLALRTGGAALGWGFQLQSPVFIAALALLFFAFGLSLHGVFALGTRIMGIGQGLTERQGLSGSFNTGILAVVVATPCTAPFMGVAVGYAIVQPAVVALTVFATLGLGLALPFLLIGFVPALARLLPRPGAWMERFKHAMAFPMYLSVAWLLWVLVRQAGSTALLAVLVAMVAVALAATLWHNTGLAARVLRWAALALAAVLVASPVVRHGEPATAAAVESNVAPWSPERVAELRARGDTVFVNFTADWCITCLANERATLSSARVRALFDAPDVHYLKADWTRADPLITEALAEHGRNGVPLYLVYRNGGAPEVLPQVLTANILRRALTGE